MLRKVGVLQDVQRRYEAGQAVVHTLFGYRGVIAASWLAKCYDEVGGVQTLSRSERHYCVTRDRRDEPDVDSESPSFVAHSMLLPFNPTEPLDELCAVPSGGILTSFGGRRFTSRVPVFAATTHDVTVTAIPFLNVNHSHGRQFLWTYNIMIHNKSEAPLQVQRRFWVAKDAAGVRTVSGEGVVGRTPVIAPRDRFEYDSEVFFESPAASMGGHYVLSKPDGQTVNITIPTMLMVAGGEPGEQ